MSLRRKLLGSTALFLLSVLLIAGGYAAYVVATGNVREVAPGLMYRSGQLGPAGLERLAQAHGLRSVLNLRGPNPDEAWYRAETNACAKLGLYHRDVALSAGMPLTDTQIPKLIEILKQVPKPVLIHCNGGADRTGLVAAVYRYSIAGEPADVAYSELSWKYGHIPYLHWSYSRAMDVSFWRVVSNSPPGLVVIR